MNHLTPSQANFVTEAVQQAVANKVKEISEREAERASKEVHRQVIAAAVDIARAVQTRLAVSYDFTPDKLTIQIVLKIDGGGR